ncbi:MAG: CPBP family intramembrane metalloprotease [Arcobacter sp.]|nr:CPBP family intramembrane metalloprotease [Arcobacter sp.]
MIYEKILSDPISLCTYLFLAFSILSLFINKKYKTWIPLFLISLGFAYISNRVNLNSIFIISFFAISIYIMQNKNYRSLIRYIFGFLVLLVSILLFTHNIIGFENWKIIDNIILSDSSIPYSLYLNFDKAIIGLFIIALSIKTICNKDEWFKMLKTAIPLTVLAMATIYSLAYIMNFVAIDIKFPNMIFIWIFANLFFVCVAEEALFRGFMQKNIQSKLSNFKYGNSISLILVSFIFGLAHFPGGLNYIILSTIAGLFYGYVYQKTKNIEASILMHFIVNLGHIIFFSYPALKHIG